MSPVKVAHKIVNYIGFRKGGGRVVEINHLAHVALVYCVLTPKKLLKNTIANLKLSAEVKKSCWLLFFPFAEALSISIRVTRRGLGCKRNSEYFVRKICTTISSESLAANLEREKISFY